MQVRRCKVLYLEPREDVGFDLGQLLAGGTGLQRTLRWVALAAHLGQEIEVDAAERALLGELSTETWTDTRTLEAASAPVLKRLLQCGLAIGTGKRHALHRERDQAVRQVHWHPLAATLHAFTRWEGADAVQSMHDTGTGTALEMRQTLGPPPAEVVETSARGVVFALPRRVRDGFDELLARRATCRNFDGNRPLAAQLLAHLLQRVFAAQAQVRISGDTVFLKKSSPSGGGLHPVEAYLVVQNVDGLAPGLYHYHAVDHALVPMPDVPQPLAEFCLHALAGQHWFANAQVLVALAPRYDRSFWKYRQHPKAYRAVVLEAGHLSQTLYLAATEAGLGAFITCAINEVALEQAFGLDPARDGVLAVCGVGWRGEAMQTPELDPGGEVWSSAGHG